MTPFFDHPNDAPPSAGGWHNLGLLTASLAVMLVVAASANLMRNPPLGARTAVDPEPSPVNVQLSSSTTPSTETGSGDPAGTVEAAPMVEQMLVSPNTELDAVPLPEIPVLAALPDVPAPKPEAAEAQPDARPQSPSGTATTTPAQRQPSTTTGTNTGTSNTATNSSSNSSGTGTPAVQQLQFGVGAGRQPAPSYPSRALSRGHEGTVVVQFTVSESGKIEDARAVKPSRYPELNSAAISTIRRRWKFPAGQQRIYQIAINFQIR